jgi:hypothetical protein
METALIVLYVFIVASWVIPTFIKSEKHKGIVRLSLSAIALGIWIGHIVTKYLP